MTNITLHVGVGVKSTSHTGGLGLLYFHGGRRAGAMCGGRQWSLC